MSTSQELPTLSWLRQEALAGRLSRRSALKRGVALGLSAPVLAALLAACGSDDKATSTAGTGGAATTPTAGSGTSGGSTPAASATTGSTGSPTTGSPSSGGSTGAVPEVPGHGRGK